MIAQRSPPGRRALIVEDETLVALYLEAEMRALGFHVCLLAADPQEAFLLVMDDQPDVVLMDVNLQDGHDGIRAARWLREVSDVPIIFVTGCADGATVQRIHEQVPGAPILSKPVSRDQLTKTVAEVVEPHH